MSDSTGYLVLHGVINKEFFVKGSRPSKNFWIELIKSGVIEGKVLNDKVFIDRNRFAVNTVFEPPKNQTAVDLLMKSA